MCPELTAQYPHSIYIKISWRHLNSSKKVIEQIDVRWLKIHFCQVALQYFNNLLENRFFFKNFPPDDELKSNLTENNKA